ncbi:MAG: hypothetical protein AABX39_00465 [Nanoarchaeota archaeon]
MVNIGRISVELAVFLMISLVAFGGFVTMPSSSSGSDASDEYADYEEIGDSGNEITGDKSWRKKLKQAVAAPIKKVQAEAKRVETKVAAEAKRVETKVATGMVKAVSYPFRKPGSYINNAKDVKKATQLMATAAGIVAGIGPIGGEPGQQPPTQAQVNEQIALWGADGHQGATSARNLLEGTEYASLPNAQVPPKDRWFPSGYVS